VKGGLCGGKDVMNDQWLGQYRITLSAEKGGIGIYAVVDVEAWK
jgi:hypothetical protein